MLKILRLKKSTVQKVFKWITMSPVERQKNKKKKQRLKTKQKQEKQARIKLFGRLRIVLAWLFGEWVLWSWQKTQRRVKA